MYREPKIGITRRLLAGEMRMKKLKRTQMQFTPKDQISINEIIEII